MLFQNYSALDWLIIELLGTHRSVSAAWLHQQIQTLHKKCSVQAVYKQLRGLQAQGIVVRWNRSFSLSLWWSLKFIEFAGMIETTYLDSLQESEITINPGEKRTWHFSSLLRMDDFLMQLILNSHRRSREKLLYQWAPHPWFYFAQMEKVRHYYDAYRKENNKMKFLIGGETFLDRLYVQDQRHNMSVCKVLKAPFLGKKYKHIFIIGPLLILTAIDAATYNQIDRVFEETKSLAGVSLRKVLALFNSKARITLTYEHNESKAKSLVKKFEDVLTG